MLPTSSPAPLKSGPTIATLDDHLTPAGCHRWLSRELNREPEAYDLYKIGKALYQHGRYLGAAKFLQMYIDRPGNELPGYHLLGYAYAFTDEKRKAIQQLKKVANSQSKPSKEAIDHIDALSLVSVKLFACLLTPLYVTPFQAVLMLTGNF